MRESTIEKAVCSYAKSKGWHNVKLGGLHDRGKPDRLFFTTGGRVKFIEFKAPGKKLGPLQAQFLAQLAVCDLSCYIVDNVAGGMRLFDE